MEQEEKLKEEVVKGLVNHALGEVRRKYGSGEDGDENIKKYHNENHTKSVKDEALRLGERRSRMVIF